MSEQIDRWRDLASRLGLTISSPATILVGDDSVTFTALLPELGGRRGMIADHDWEVINPHTETLRQLGYAFSAVELGGDLDRDSLKEMFRDWGWTADGPKPPWW